MKYLYGAAVQGIQNFIFQTNELKDIVGASELVENICTIFFDKKLEENQITAGEKIIGAAGNIKYIFDSKEDCAKIVKIFPKEVVTYAPGVTVSQAVVEYKHEDFKSCINELEDKLKVQRNKPMQSATIGLLGARRSRTTNKPAVLRIQDKESKEDEYLDDATVKKRYDDIGLLNPRLARKLCSNAFDIDEQKLYSNIPLNIEEMTGKNEWIAVIHADGNALGQVVQKVGMYEDIYKLFSKELDRATKDAAKAAFKEIKPLFRKDDENDIKHGMIPIRPLVLSGDDFTVICRADLAIPYMESYLRNFEDITQNYLGKTVLYNEDKNIKVFNEGRQKNCLTACAGIAFVKSSFPFYYAYKLAESLCKAAKNDAKYNREIKNGNALPASCLMFHKVQDSFIESYEDIRERELHPQANVSLAFGPYYLHNEDTNLFEKENSERIRWTIKELKDKVVSLDSREGNATKTHIRRWMTLIQDDTEMAEQYVRRVNDIGDSLFSSIVPSNKSVKLITRTVNDKTINCYPAYDVLALHTIRTQETK